MPALRVPLFNHFLERGLSEPLQVAVDREDDGRPMLVGKLGARAKGDRLAETINFLDEQA